MLGISVKESCKLLLLFECVCCHGAITEGLVCVCVCVAICWQSCRGKSRNSTHTCSAAIATTVHLANNLPRASFPALSRTSEISSCTKSQMLGELTALSRPSIWWGGWLAAPSPKPLLRSRPFGPRTFRSKLRPLQVRDKIPPKMELTPLIGKSEAAAVVRSNQAQC